MKLIIDQLRPLLHWQLDPSILRSLASVLE